MQNIPQQLLLDRIDSLPRSLKETLFSYDEGSFVWELCEKQHLPEHKIDAVATLTGDVILGFLHIKDFEETLLQELTIDKNIVHVIATEIQEKIFAPVQDEIIKNYSPLSEESIRLAEQQSKKPPKERLAVVEQKLQKEATAPESKKARKQESNDEPTKQAPDKKQTLKVNPALLGLTRTSPNNESNTNKRIDESTNVPKAAGQTKKPQSDKPLVLFGEDQHEGREQDANNAKKQARPVKGFSMPFGFFGKEGEDEQLASAGPVKASVEGGASASKQESKKAMKQKGATVDLSKVVKKEEAKVVNYSTERTRNTPFAEEEKLFSIKTPQASGKKDKTPPSNTVSLKGVGPGKQNKPTVERQQSEGAVSVKKGGGSPFGFPGSTMAEAENNRKGKSQDKKGKPRIQGNTVHLQ